MKVFLVLGTLLLSITACTQHRGYYKYPKVKKEYRLNPRECMRYSGESQRKKCLRYVYEVNERRIHEMDERLMYELDDLYMRKMDSMKSLKNGTGQGDLGLYRTERY